MCSYFHNVIILSFLLICLFSFAFNFQWIGPKANSVYKLLCLCVFAIAFKSFSLKRLIWFKLNTVLSNIPYKVGKAGDVDMWHVTGDAWQMTGDTWHMTHDMIIYICFNNNNFFLLVNIFAHIERLSVSHRHLHLEIKCLPFELACKEDNGHGATLLSGSAYCAEQTRAIMSAMFCTVHFESHALNSANF